MLSVALTDWRWCNALTAALPYRFEKNLISRYTSRYQDDAVAANVWLRVTMKKLVKVKMPKQALTSDSAAVMWASEYYKARFTTAKNTFLIIDELPARFRHLCAYAAAVGFKPPVEGKTLSREKLALAVYKMDSESWWQRQAKTTARRAREYMAIALGLITGDSAYISREALTAFKVDQQANAEFLQNNWIGLDVETDSGFCDQVQLTLAEAAAAGVSNPEIRRLEMMCRIRGMEETAQATGRKAVFLTWTAPSSYHFNSGRKWNGSDPRDTQKYLANQWAKARAELNQAGICFAGIRVVEPHKDETPHWHLLIFVPAEQLNDFLAICRRYALQHSPNEKGAQQHRFVVEHIDPAKGSAVGYIAKYIAKSINGAECADLADDETGLPFDETALRVRAWASVWSIRQFQFVGAPSVSVWRELRRISSQLSDESEAVRAAADTGNFAEFISLMGGLNAPREAYPVSLMKEKETDSAGIAREKIKGIETKSGLEVVTRAAWVRLGSLAGGLSRFTELLTLQGASRAAWTRGNNCKLLPRLADLADLANAAIAALKQELKCCFSFLDAAGAEKTEVLLYDREEIERINGGFSGSEFAPL